MARKRKLVTGWRLLFAAIAACGVLWGLNEHFIRAAPARGFYPPDTYLMLSSWDFPRAWLAIDHSDVFERMEEDWPRPYRDLELQMRLVTGVRPTPERWSIWLGRRLVFACAPEGTGLTAYPGRLLRWAHALRGLVGYGPDTEGIARYRDLYYAWRDGYLIASASREYVAAALTGASAPLLHSNSDALMTLQWEGVHAGYVNIRRGDGLPVAGQLDFAVTDGARPLTLPNAWPRRPAISLTARDAGDLWEVWSALDNALARSTDYAAASSGAAKAWTAWGLQRPGLDWTTGADHLSLALLEVDTRSTLPVPGVAWAMRFSDEAPGLEPLERVFASRPFVPYQWDGNHGFMAPILGMEMSPCAVRTLHDWVLTTTEPLMAEVAGHLADGPACAAEVDVALRASWSELGKIAEGLALRLAEDELIPRMNTDDIGATVVPKIKALSMLGEIALDGVAREGTLKFSGHLAKSEEGETP